MYVIHIHDVHLYPGFCIPHGLFANGTQMQTQIRQTTTLREQDIVPFITLHTDGNLVSPEESGYVLGSAVLKAGKGLSGGFWSWDGAECKEFRRVRN